MATYQRGNSNQEDTVTDATEQTNWGTFGYKIKCKWWGVGKLEWDCV